MLNKIIRERTKTVQEYKKQQSLKNPTEQVKVIRKHIDKIKNNIENDIDEKEKNHQQNREKFQQLVNQSNQKNKAIYY